MHETGIKLIDPLQGLWRKISDILTWQVTLNPHRHVHLGGFDKNASKTWTSIPKKNFNIPYGAGSLPLSTLNIM